jgi:hypothetical protein
MVNKDEREAQVRDHVPDVRAVYRDTTGESWEVLAEFKLINGRIDIAAVTVRSIDLRTPVSRRLLGELQPHRLFREQLKTDLDKLTQLKRSRIDFKAHRGRPHSESELRSVADIYLAAHEARVPVQRAVAEALGVSVSTAAKRIMAARAIGFITPSRKNERKSTYGRR